MIIKAKCIIPLLILSTLIPLLTLSCSKSNDEPKQEKLQVPYLKLGDDGVSTTFSVSSDKQTFSLKVLTNRACKTDITIQNPWITFKDMIKSADSDVVEFVYDIESNDSGEERSGTFVIVPDDEDSQKFGVGVIVIEIIQAAKFFDNP